MPTTLDRIKELNDRIKQNRQEYEQLTDAWHEEVTVPARKLVLRGREITGRPGYDAYAPTRSCEWRFCRIPAQIRNIKGEPFIFVHWEQYYGEGNWDENSDHPTLRFPARWLNDPDAAMEELRAWTAERAERREEKARLKQEEEEQRKQNEHREFIKREAQRLGIL